MRSQVHRLLHFPYIYPHYIEAMSLGNLQQEACRAVDCILSFIVKLYFFQAAVNLVQLDFYLSPELLGPANFSLTSYLPCHESIAFLPNKEVNIMYRVALYPASSMIIPGTVPPGLAQTLYHMMN